MSWYVPALLALVVVPLASLQSIDQPAAASDVMEQPLDVAAVSSDAIQEDVPASVDAVAADEPVEEDDTAPAADDVIPCDDVIPAVDGADNCEDQADASEGGYWDAILKFLHII